MANSRDSSVPIDQSLGAALRQLRQTRGVNQTELGRALGVSLQQIQKYEAGSNRLAASTLYRAAEFLGVDIGALYAGAGAASAGKRRPTGATKDGFLIIPAPKGSGPRGAREAELIDVIRSYQAIETSSERALVRKLLKRLAGGPAKRTPT